MITIEPDDDRGKDEQLSAEDQAAVDAAPQPQDLDTGDYDDGATVDIDGGEEDDDDDPENRDAPDDEDDDDE